jgi:hypothetical protein
VCAMEERGSLGVKRCAAAQDGEQANLFVEPGEPEPVEVNVKGVRVGRTRRFGGPRGHSIIAINIDQKHRRSAVNNH